MTTTIPLPFKETVVTEETDGLTRSAEVILPKPRRLVEHFDANTVTLCGEVRKVWSFVDDVFARLVIATYTSHEQSLKLMLPRGFTHDGRMVTLRKGMQAHVTGFLREVSYPQSLYDFLGAAKLPDRIEPGDGHITLSRMATYVVVEKLCSGDEVSDTVNSNRVTLSGVVVKAWQSQSALYARLAIYDRHCEIIQGQSDARRDGLPRRRAHYVTIRLPNGRTIDGHEVTLNRSDKVRLTGYVDDVPYQQSLHNFLTRTRQIDRIRENDADIRVGRITTYVTVESLICFS